MNLTAQEIAAAQHALDEILTDAGLGAEEDVTKGAHPGLMIYKTGNTPTNVGIRVRLALGAAIIRRLRVNKDAARWRFCMEHGFPKACFNPDREVHYFYVRADVGAEESLGWDTPLKAIDGTMKLMEAQCKSL